MLKLMKDLYPEDGCLSLMAPSPDFFTTNLKLFREAFLHC